MNKPLFSLTIIARNEAKVLPTSLAPSLEDFIARGGDVVLVDTGSTDGTPDIARALGFRVFEEGNRFRIPIGDHADEINSRFIVEGEEPIIKPGDTLFHFADARNCAVDHALNDFVMIADCDEWFTTLDVDALNKRILDGAQRMDISYVHDHMPDGSPRIAFRRGVFFDRRCCRWKGAVHETIYDNAPFVKLDSPPQSEVFLQHRQHASDNRRVYMAGLAWECWKNPDNDRQSHYFGRELLYGNRLRSAIKEFTRHISMPHAWRIEQAQSMIYIGDCRGYMKDFNGAIEAWQIAFTMAPVRREALMRLAWSYYQNGDHQPAAAYAAAALTIPWGGNYCDQKNHYTYEPHEILYVSLWWLGDKEGSRYHWEKALSYAPTNPKYVADAAFYR